MNESEQRRQHITKALRDADFEASRREWAAASTHAETALLLIAAQAVDEERVQMRREMAACDERHFMRMGFEECE